jgi:hypothetical protein
VERQTADGSKAHSSSVKTVTTPFHARYVVMTVMLPDGSQQMKVNIWHAMAVTMER